MKKLHFLCEWFSKFIINWERSLFFLCLLIGINVNGQAVWNLIKDKNNIKVYTADNNSSSFKNIKVIGVFDGTLDKLAEIFLDVDKQKKWVYGTKQSYLLKKLDDTDLLYYVETALPLVSNRDIAIHMKLNENKTKNI